MIGCSQTNLAEQKPIVPDPDWQQGVLTNGMKYHFHPKAGEPVEIRFLIHAGSLQETEQQQGYAHFLEHMAFNGSQHFSENDVVALFEKVGVDFGNDLNAYTYYDHTVYQIALPDQTELQPALTWFRDVADGLLLTPDAIEAEKGVVLGEIRQSRPNEMPLDLQAHFALLANSEHSKHDVLGTKASIENIDPAELAAFYASWYQPNNAELVISGDFTAMQAEQLVSEMFTSWQQDPGAQQAEDFKVNPVGENPIALIAPQGQLATMSIVFDLEARAFSSHADQQKIMNDNLLNILIEQRLRERMLATNTPIHAVMVMPFDLLDRKQVVIDISFNASDRIQSQAFLAKELASLRDHGVGAVELSTALALFNRDLENIDGDWRQMTSGKMADVKVYALIDQMPVQAKEDYKANLTAFIESNELAKTNKALKNRLSKKSTTPFFGIEKQEQPFELELTNQAYKVLFDAEGAPLLMAKTMTDFPVPSTLGAIVSTEQISPDTTKWQLGNGVEVWLKQMPAAEKQVYMYYSSLGGIAALDPALYAASNLTVNTFLRSGLGDFNAAQLNQYMTRNETMLNPFIDETQHGFYLQTRYEKVPLAFAALREAASHAKVNEVQFKQVQQQFASERDNWLASSGGRFNAEIYSHLYTPDSLRYIHDGKTYQGVSAGQVQQVYRQLFGQNRGFKLVVVGNIEADELVPLLTRYVANIPMAKPSDNHHIIEFDKQPEDILLPISNESGMFYGVSFLAEGNAKTVEDVFAEDMMLRVFSQRAITLLREKYGLGYSPTAFNIMPDGSKVSRLILEINADAGKLDLVRSAMAELIGDLRSGITEEERDSAAKQLASDLKPMATNAQEMSWFMTRYLVHGYGLDAVNDPDKQIEQISRDDINHLIERLMGSKTTQLEHVLMPKS
ncbi:M16 family metallopeptidase [Photobacterium sp.]|uniref:M16 family metallopeptidase n=1 Tax=Photobacterium sp. TaxID=660 RepID=UPI00299E2B14|nr:insulinase family protein [Photobacterium sp.]MDX1303213.1 insulinase family protein [Photobacterium sp.]